MPPSRVRNAYAPVQPTSPSARPYVSASSPLFRQLSSGSSTSAASSPSPSLPTFGGYVSDPDDDEFILPAYEAAELRKQQLARQRRLMTGSAAKKAEVYGTEESMSGDSWTKKILHAMCRKKLIVGGGGGSGAKRVETRAVTHIYDNPYDFTPSNAPSAFASDENKGLATAAATSASAAHDANATAKRLWPWESYAEMRRFMSRPSRLRTLADEPTVVEVVRVVLATSGNHKLQVNMAFDDGRRGGPFDLRVTTLLENPRNRDQVLAAISAHVSMLDGGSVFEAARSSKRHQ